MKYLPTILLGTAASALMFTSEMPAAVAQQQPSQQQAPQPGQPMSPQGNSMAVDEEEIQRFANAFESVQSIQDKSREQMAQVLEQQGLSIKEYNELFRQQQQANAGGESESNFSEEKQQKFEQADARIDQIEQEAQSEIEQAITQEGLQVERFEEIWVAVRQDPELQQRVQNVLQN